MKKITSKIVSIVIRSLVKKIIYCVNNRIHNYIFTPFLCTYNIIIHRMFGDFKTANSCKSKNVCRFKDEQRSRRIKFFLPI